MKNLLFLLILVFHAQLEGQILRDSIRVNPVANNPFTADPCWRGADGAASIDLKDGRILWLFSDTFFHPEGKGIRQGATFLHNSLAIQYVDSLGAPMEFIVGGSQKAPQDFFPKKGPNWFWTGHGTRIQDKLVIFLLEVSRVEGGLGFASVGWSVAIIENPEAAPNNWQIRYVQGPDKFGVKVGSAAVWYDQGYVYTFGVKEPGNHSVYAMRIDADSLLAGQVNAFEWWIADAWQKHPQTEPVEDSLFHGEVEFSVHYDAVLHQFIQIQTYGFGRAGIGYRLADRPQGPWTPPHMVYTPKLANPNHFVYAAKAHPELRTDGLAITYQINSLDFKELLENQTIYFPHLILLSLYW